MLGGKVLLEWGVCPDCGDTLGDGLDCTTCEGYAEEERRGAHREKEQKNARTRIGDED